ncbi:LysR substrate-binding domain-containing protein [Xylophilus sp.]|uniref:LysR substrate-binding domain-containing protein n=1 Tax=Xylophilus sp. TaxID=2653893 RepID=UPI0013BB4A9C|nr:LysR substrate-binding domain-containing protein [Xylophilus sp.]KAF1050024.1 MAG: HTH-type transcriptional regulator cbl [Xylophilus sp.]
MNFQQLRILRETTRWSFNLTEVSEALHTSPSGVSKHIRDLEDELGIQLFVRHGKRLLGLTEPGREMLRIVERILRDLDNVKQLARDFTGRDSGAICIATTHTLARYRLSDTTGRFNALFPQVQIDLFPTSPTDIVERLRAGTADVAVGGLETLEGHDDLAAFVLERWHHAVVVPHGHPLLARQLVTLADLAAYPLIIGTFARHKISQAFEAARLAPNIALTAIDSDIIKAYTERGMGVGIVAPHAVDPQRDAALTVIPGETLFPEYRTLIAVKKGRHLRSFDYRFIELCQPLLDEAQVRRHAFATAG